MRLTQLNKWNESSFPTTKLLSLLQQKGALLFSKVAEGFVSDKQWDDLIYSRLPFEKPDDEDFIRIQNNIEEVLVQLQTLSSLPSLETEVRI